MPEPILESRQNEPGAPDYKARLDGAADEAKKQQPREDQNQGIMNKVSQYVPTVGKLLGNQQEDPKDEPSTAKDASGPANDTQIEEFLRDQHGSKRIIGMDEPTQA
ncbi:hypothetical protein C7999DRAFT_28770 [Corynascus novoguineensis]|uniref:Uncharacterized protein n=1 Tax=Corynascus novoguineensis TaxID=1126955 RepID=A0AAN7CYQ6_9PEZI|nr:hypothetical protein C7999DRAFT_28770 [Corynascus novoguineensis]